MAQHNDRTPAETALTFSRRGGWPVMGYPRWLVIAWILLFAMSMLTLVLYIVGTPVYFAHISTLCANCVDERLTLSRLQSLHALGFSIMAYAAYWTAINLLFALVYCAVAAFIFWHKPGDQTTLFASFSLVAWGASFSDIPSTLASVHPGWWLPVTLLDAPGFPSLVIFLFLFPSGRFVPGFTRWVAGGFAALYMTGTFFPGSIFNLVHSSRLLILLVIIIVFGSLVFAQIYRYRRVSTPEERQQTKWVVFGAIIALLGFLLLAFLPLALSQLIFSGQPLSLLPYVFVVTNIYLLLLLIPLSIAVAILRYRLWDIDIIINRTLVYGTMTVSVIGIYVLVVGYLGVLFRTSGNLLISLIATGLVAVLFQPLRGWLQAGVNRLMYGQRDEPYTVITRMSQRLEVTLAPDAILPTIVETVASALKLPAAVIEFAREGTFEPIASYGKPVGEMVVLPLNYQGETIGQLRLAPRTPGEAFTPADRRLLDELARHAGLAAHAVRLTTDLQRSRERIVTAREEERRRLRRDLHDGLGATLAALHLQAGAIRTLMRHDLNAAEMEILDLQAEIRATVTDIRRLVYALRPPTLDELGLVEAIRQHAAQHETPGMTEGVSGEHDEGLRIVVEAPEQLPTIPAAVEIAAYRIVQEALTNVVRHAHAHACTIRLAFTAMLQIEVIDDGVGLPTVHSSGVGLFSLHERAAELGGSCVVEPAPGRGTRVLALLPLPKE